MSKLPRLSDIYVSFVENSKFNAWAGPNRGRYFIGIQTGLLTILTGVVFRMLADPRSFPEVGEPKEEVDDLPLFAITSDAAASTLPPVVPKNAQRQRYAEHLCNTVFDFIITHEVTHIGHGHTDYIKAESGIPFLSELGWLEGTAAGNLESQAMEMDADFNAAKLVVMNVRRLVSIRDQLPKEIAEFYRDPTRAMFDVAAAICIQSRLFGDTRLTLADLATADHPPHRWRQLMVLNVMANYVNHIWGGAAADSVLPAINQAIEGVEEAFERMTGQPQQVQGLHDVWHGDGWKYAEAVSNCWNNTMKAKFGKYAFTELPRYGFDLPKS